MFFLGLKWWALQSSQCLLLSSALPRLLYDWDWLFRGYCLCHHRLFPALQSLSIDLVLGVWDLFFNFSTFCSKIISFLSSLSTVLFNFYLFELSSNDTCVGGSSFLQTPSSCQMLWHFLYLGSFSPIQFSHSFWSWFFWALLFNKFVLDVSTWLALLALPNSSRSVLLKAIFRIEGL